MSWYEQKPESLNSEDYRRHDAVLKVIEDSPFSSALDAGCYRFTIANELYNRVGNSRKLIGLDLAFGGLKSQPFSTVQGNICYLPFKDDSVDLIMCNDTLEHLDSRALEHAFYQLERVAERWILITVPYTQKWVVCSSNLPVVLNFDIKPSVGTLPKQFFGSLLDSYIYRYSSLCNKGLP